MGRDIKLRENKLVKGIFFPFDGRLPKATCQGNTFTFIPAGISIFIIGDVWEQNLIKSKTKQN